LVLLSTRHISLGKFFMKKDEIVKGKDEIVKGIANKWIEKAEKDLLTSERELSFQDPVTDTVCFHCQQAVEKYLKAFLVFHQVYFTKTHNIGSLIELCATIDASFNDELEDADTLTDYAVEIRYPDSSWPEPNIEEARESYAIARKVKKFVQKKFR
jgi:HEPN domain-containing protein